MNAKVFTTLRILLGVFILIFGINKFLNFLPAPEGMSAEASAYFGALVSSKTLILVAIVEIVAGIALILNKFGALLALILMSISVNAVLYHAVLDIGNIAPALILLLLNSIAIYSYKDKYKDLLKG